MSVVSNLYVKTELFANKVDGTTLTTADWAFLGTVDQNIAKADEVEFKALTVNNASFTTKLQTGATGNYTLTLPVDDGTANQVLATDGSGVLSWTSNNNFDQSLNTTDSVQFVNVTATGDLTVSGTTTIINTTNTSMEDNIILLNNGEPGASVTEGSAGLEIDRGTGTNQQLLFDDANGDVWTVGESGGVLGTAKFRVGELADAAQTQGAIPGYDANGRLAEAEGLTSSEVDQLQNIDAVTVSNAQWANLGNMDQDVSTTSNVTFNDVTVNGTLNVTGAGIARSVSALLVADPNPLADGITRFSTVGGAIPATLPDAVASSGMCYTVLLAVAGNNLTITPEAGDTIEGLATIVLDTAKQHITLCSDGTTDWYIASS